MLVLLSVCLCCCHCRVTLHRAGAGCCFRVLLCALCAMDGSCCRCRRCQSGVCALERAYAGAAARCCHQSSLYSLCFGVWLLVPLQGASVRVLFALWSFVASAARCKVLLFALWSLVPGAAAGVLLEGCAVRELFALWSLVRCRVLQLECDVRFGAGMLVPLEGVGTRYYCQRAVCILGTCVRVRCAL